MAVSDGFWQAIDGKELRGSIDGLKGEKRGENVVRMVSDQDLQSQIIGFYQGKKESEKTVVKNYVDSLPTLFTLFEAVRNHWSVEIDNYVRDVTLGEDHIRCKDSKRMRAIACLINVGLNLMRKQNIDNNFVALREELNFDRKKAINCLSPS